jgi:hypothetical protein
MYPEESVMSHVVSVQTEIRDTAAVRAACRRMGLPEPVFGKTRLFSGEVEGLAVQLPDWQYPIVCDTASGQLKYDNFGGRWGDERHLERFLQMYAVEKCRIEARRSGRTMTEQTLANGSIKLTIQIAGGAA